MALSWRAAPLVAVGLVWVVLSPTTGTAWAWFALVAAMCGLDALLAVSPRSLGVSREVVGPLRADETTTSTVTVSNPNRRGVRLDLRDAWPPSLRPTSRHRLTIAAGATAHATTRLSPTRRGTRHADYVTLRVWGPLGLGARQVSLAAPLTLTVLPEFRSRRLLPTRLARLHELEGAAATTLRGPGTEFDSLRDYVRGDDPRDIDWRASARSRELVVRTWRPERDRHVVLVLDAGRSGALLLGAPGVDEGGRPGESVALGEAPRLDAGIEAALLLAALADRAGDNVHLLALDRTVRARVSGVRGPGLMREMASALADVSASLDPLDWSLVVSEVRRSVRHRCLVVLFTELPPAGSDPDFLEAVAQLSARHVVLVASAQDPTLGRLAGGHDDAHEVFAAAAADATLRAQDEGARDAEAAGAVVLGADAGLLAARVSDRYLALKKAGRL